MSSGFLVQPTKDLNRLTREFGVATLSDTTPAAPEGAVNVAWQTDIEGNISASVPASGGGGGVVPGTQLQLPFYAAGGAVVTATQITSDATGRNLNVPKLATIGTLNSTSTQTLPSGSIAALPNFYVQSTSTGTIQGSGFSFGNLGGWTVAQGQFTTLNTAVRGIHQGQGFVVNKHAVGDTAGIYGYVNTDGGVSAGADEGVTGLQSEITENGPYFHGTVTATTGTGDTRPLLGVTSGNNWTTDGAFLLNISKGTVSGQVLSASQPFSPTTSAGVQGTYLNYLPVTVNAIPVSTACGITTVAIPDQEVTADSPVSCTVTVTLVKIGGVYKPFTNGSHVVVAGYNYPEQSILTNVVTNGDGTQTLTLKLRNPNDQAIIFQGGVAGQYLSFDANLAFSGARSSYYAFGSLTGSDLIYGLNVAGGLEGNLLPQIGSEAATHDGGSASGFHLYPGAEVVANPNFNAPTPTLEQNNVPWAVGDVIENPHYPVFGGTAAWFVKTHYTPANASHGDYGLLLSVGGFGFAGGNTGLIRIQNTNPLSYYQGNGGPLFAPYGLALEGAQTVQFYAPQAHEPGGATILVQNPNNQANPNAVVEVVNINYDTGGHFQFTPANGLGFSGTWSVTGGFHAQNGFSTYSTMGGTVTGVTGSFTTADSKTVTVSNGIITGIA